MTQPTQDRRSFLQRCGRITGFAALTTLCGLLIEKRTHQNCIILNACDACMLFKQCQQPQAVETREHTPATGRPS